MWWGGVEVGDTLISSPSPENNLGSPKLSHPGSKKKYLDSRFRLLQLRADMDLKEKNSFRIFWLSDTPTTLDKKVLHDTKL